MNRRKDLTDDMVAREWEMFVRVSNPGGKASCQQSPGTFAIMRAAQLASWSDALLESYLADLKNAALAGRNLLSEKYGHMMQSTAPDEYARIASRLPVIAPRALDFQYGANRPENAGTKYTPPLWSAARLSTSGAEPIRPSWSRSHWISEPARAIEPSSA